MTRDKTEGEGFEPSMEEKTPTTVFESVANRTNSPRLLGFSVSA
jgi:hypothetical protein